ncbi:Pycsar system effector family protein [Actinoplanes sp. NPDC026623]|uniref:Pycsar system effector family protein n=1 Tax=Actinoplanes sp. NPDC026623 TaxID=3155610 RepID=UPI0033D39B97
MEQQNATVATEQELAIALTALERVQIAIRRADTKAAGLVGFQLSVLTIALGRAGDASRVWHSSPADRPAAILLAVLLVAGLGGSLSLLGAVIWPRLSGEGTGNLFAFPALATRDAPPRAHYRESSDDAWRLAMRLSRTARRKYELIRWAMWSMAGSTTAIVGWLCLIGASQ